MLAEVISIIREIEFNKVAMTTTEKPLSGYSGNKIIASLQELTKLFIDIKDSCYLEVGVFQGLTLLSVANACPSIPCYGIDNFAYFDPDNKNFNIVKQRMQQLSVKNAHILNKDYEDALESLETYIGTQKIGVYFVDGPHDYRSQLMCLELARPLLHEQAVIVVDDCNYSHVRQANRDFLIVHPEYKLIFEAYTPCHPKNMTPQLEKEAREGWWNGVNILARDTHNKLKCVYPPTNRSRQLYENEHITHASSVSEYLPQAIQVVEDIDNFNPLRIVRGFTHLYSSLRTSKMQRRHLFKSMNTHSEDLPSFNFNSIK